jgi:hypothetical protein
VSKADPLAKHYEKLTSDERFRLRLHALARGDMETCQRLDRTCSHVAFPMYADRITASEVLTLCLLVDILPKLSKLTMVGGMRLIVEYLEGATHDAGWLGYLDGYRAGWKAAGKRGEPPDVSDDELTEAGDRAYRNDGRFSEVLDQIAASLAASARMPRDAYARFGDEVMGVPFEVLLRAWGRPVLALLDEHGAALDAAEEDAEGYALMSDVLRLAWRRNGLNLSCDGEVGDLRARFEALQRGDDGGLDD